MSPSSTGAAASASDAAKTPGVLWSAWPEDDCDSDPRLDPMAQKVTEWFVGRWPIGADEPECRILIGQGRSAEIVARRIAEKLTSILNTDAIKAAALAPPAVPESVRRLSEAATQGEWYAESEKCDGSYGSGEDSNEGYLAYSIVTDAEKPHGSPGVIAETSNSTLSVIHEEWNEDDFTAWDDVAKNNTAFIVAAVNYVRTLLSPAPSPDGPKVSAPPGGGGVVDAEARGLLTRAQAILAAIWNSGEVAEGQFDEIASWSAQVDATLAAAPATPEPAKSDGFTIIPEAVLSSEDAHALIVGDAVVVPAAPEIAAGGGREIVGPVAWVIPGDETADANGCIEARCVREGEFTRPLYALSAPAGAQTAGGEGWIKGPPPKEPDFYGHLPDAADEGLGWAVSIDDDAVLWMLWWEATETGSRIAWHRRPVAGPEPTPPSSTTTAHDAPEGGNGHAR